jgi:hypothetical protein
MTPASSREALIARLPRTMAASMNEQLARASLLFPVERRLLDERLEWLARLDRAEFDRLFAALNAVESRMQLPAWSKDDDRFSIEHTAIIARSPLYPDWRREAERAFVAIDEGVEKLHPAAGIARLLICILPPGLPLSPEPWRDVPSGGVRVALEREFGDMQGDLLAAVARRKCPSELTLIERTWVVACESRSYSDLTAATVVAWNDTAKLRRKFLDRLNAIHRTLHSVDEAMSEMERVDLNELLPPRLTGDLCVREFIRSLLLSGNGSLVMNNSFVQWCASEALRRAQPQVLVAAFGIRDKPKPFSSLVWFEDQARANPAPDQRDPAGSLVDDEMLSRYVYFTARRLAPYAGRTLAWFAVEDRKSAIMVAPVPGKPSLMRTDRPVSVREMSEVSLKWLTAESGR